MRARFLVMSGGLSLVATAFVVQACGSTEPATPTTDAGTNVVVDAAPTDATAPKDAAPVDVDEDAATCDRSANFTTKIPDAAVADGATTTGLCLACTNLKCSQQVEDCNMDCPCQGIAADALECFLKNPTNPQICAAAFIGVEQNTQTVGLALLTCINRGCQEACATGRFQDAGN